MRFTVYLIAALLPALFAANGARAETPTASPVVVEQAWARATPKGARTGAAYLTLLNKSASADRLLGATTPLADKVQFHRETEENGVSQMRQVDAIDLAPGAKIVFKPGDMHMMIVGLKQPLTEGQTLSLTLQFQKAGSVEVTVPIEKIGAMQRGDMGSMMHGPDDTKKK